MRIWHVHSGNMYGGVERLLTALAAANNPAATSVFALAFGGRLADELRGLGVRVVPTGSVRLRYPWSVWLARRRVRRRLAQAADVVAVCHAPWALAVFGPALREAGVPTAVWLHAPVTGHDHVERLARETRPDLVIANSGYTATESDGYWPDVPVDIVHPPVPAPPADPTIRAELRAEMQVDADTVVFVQVSRMEALKGHEVFLRALGELRDDPRWTAWIVGGPQRRVEERYLDGLRQLADRLGVDQRVRFWGERSDVPRILAAADVFCQPNTAPDSFGVSLIEALYAGLPIVTSRIGGATEAVDASCAVLAAPGDHTAVADALESLLDPDARKTLSAAAASRAEKLCDPDQQAQHLIRVLRHRLLPSSGGT